MQVTGILIYPVKSLGGFAVQMAEVDAMGLVGDRRFLVVDETGRFMTQRTLPRMALVATALDATHLTLSTSPTSAVRVGRASDPAAPLRTVSVWKAENLLAEDCGDEAATFLSDFLATRCRLVRIGEKYHRPVTKAAGRPGDVVTFADACPLLVISEASLADLNDRIAEHGEEAVPMNRFRPNLVVNDCAPFAEDAWSRIQVGEVIFRSAGQCVRCIMPSIDQTTAERGKEPLRTLATYRRDAVVPADVKFGLNLINESKAGRIRVGDTVALL